MYMSVHTSFQIKCVVQPKVVPPQMPTKLILQTQDGVCFEITTPATCSLSCLGYPSRCIETRTWDSSPSRCRGRTTFLHDLQRRPLCTYTCRLLVDRMPGLSYWSPGLIGLSLVDSNCYNTWRCSLDVRRHRIHKCWSQKVISRTTWIDILVST